MSARRCGAMRPPARRQSAGFGLLEYFIASLAGLIAVLGMLVLFAGTVGKGSVTLQMTQLSHGLRAAMQLMTRDLRRANFHSSFMQCYGNSNCRADLGIEAFVNVINIAPGGDCFWYWLDRNSDGALNNDLVGAYRLGQVNGVGVLQMRVSGNDAAQCADDAGWTPITDVESIDITGLTVTNTASYSDVLSAVGDTQVVQKIQLTVQGRLVRNHDVAKTMQDLVHVRNDVRSAPSVGPS